MSGTPLNKGSEPSPDNDGGRLQFSGFAELLVAPVRLALLELAIELELPDIIARTSDLPGIAAELGATRLDKLAYILDALTATGLLHKENSAYRNSGLAEGYLRKGKPAYLGELVVALKTMQHRNICRLKDVLFTEATPVPTGHALHDEEHWRRSASGLAAYQKAGVAENMAQIAASLPGAEELRTMLDLGCGPGVAALRILKRLPGLSVALCDFPHVLQLAEQEADAAEMGGRVSFLPGDYNRLDWGREYDLVWACQSLYYASDLRAFLKRIFASLNPGGFFVSIHEGIRDEGTEPAMLVLSRLSLALEGQDVSFVKGRIAEAAFEAGFTRIRAASLSMLFDDADLEVFQKPVNPEETP